MNPLRISLCLFFLVLFGAQKLCAQPAISLNAKEDTYLTYVYPDENLPFGLTYRHFDFDVNIIELYQRYGLKIEGYQEADEKLQKLLIWSRDAVLHNTIIRYDMPDEMALDTFCILGYLYGDKAAANQVLNYLTPDDNFMKNDYYGRGAWGNIADESWAVMLIKKTGVSDETAARLLDIKLKEGRVFVEDPDNTPLNKAAVMIHELLMLKEFDGYKNEKEFWVKQGLKALKESDMASNNLLTANLVDALLFFDVKQESISPYIEILKRRKKENRYWLPDERAEVGYGHIFTTPRVLLALEHYKNAY